MKIIIKTILPIILLIAALHPVDAQSNLATRDNTWKLLSKVTFKKQYDELLGFNVFLPVFDSDIKAMAGKEVTVKGYIVPTNGYKSHTEFVFSAYPYSMCFFCGGAGPETVMEVESVEAIKYTTEPILIKGILQLNDKDINKLMYRLVKVKLVD